MSVDPEAIRQPVRGKAHRVDPDRWESRFTICGRAVEPLTEHVPLSRVHPVYRCRRCWPTTQEQP